ncbi:DUF6602 domain-containing protein [Arsukibacterium indicum]|uniref:DUF6602 domain-containing protein n=1 Tax=Arsukibacterium indicum TaxID=2848612 RepID=A0ABS6MJG1_9GAMM|nr:DUF6602 domain-containing protein [Arsukibacterium indicum]MBV2128933.1 hypothetical protein [Arsukibacterium indicum]
MNKAKSLSDVDGRAFLRQSFAAEQDVLGLHLKLASKSVTHNGVMGDINEKHFMQMLRRYLPKRYDVDTGIVIDSNGKSSQQIDIVIFDNQYTPTLLDQQSHRYIPAEAVYCVLEVKPEVNKEYISYARDKAKSVRSLVRTSVPIVHAGGQYPAKAHFEIIAGLIAPDVAWVGGLQSDAFASSIAQTDGECKLDFVLALSDRSFDCFWGLHHFSPLNNSMAYLIFRLLQKLQSLGTVPAIDWNEYAKVMSDIDE